MTNATNHPLADHMNTYHGGSTGDASLALRVALDMARTAAKPATPTPPSVAAPLILLAVAIACGILAADLIGRVIR